MNEEESKRSFKDKSLEWLGWAAFFVLFGPFAIVYILGFLGLGMPGGWFGSWFMGALTVAGVITTLDLLGSVKRHGIGELGCVIPVAAATCWWGWIFLRDLGVFE